LSLGAEMKSNVIEHEKGYPPQKRFSIVEEDSCVVEARSMNTGYTQNDTLMNIIMFNFGMMSPGNGFIRYESVQELALNLGKLF